MGIKKLLAGLSTAGLLSSFGMPLTALAATTVVVTPTNTQGWSTADTRPGGAVNFITDTTSPLPPGALQLTTDATTTAKAQYLHAASTPLSQVTELGYTTKQNTPTPASGDAAYQLVICLTGTPTATTCPGFTTLVFEPYQNGTVAPATWQTWDVDQGLFWSTKTVVCSGGTVNGTAGGPATYTFSQLKTLCPNAVVAGFGVNIGSNNPSYNVETDVFNFNGTIYNFETGIVTVSIDKYIDGAKATTTTANNSAFPMVSSWSASNLGSGSGGYSLSPTGFNTATPYQAVTSDMTKGSSYTTNEVTGGSVVATKCSLNGAPFALAGYSVGDSPSAAQAAPVTTTAPNLTDIQTNKYIIVRNITCTTPTNIFQCFNGGFSTFTNPTFTNQGQCISFVVSSRGGSSTSFTVRNNNNVNVSSSTSQTSVSGNSSSGINTVGGSATSGNASNTSTTTTSVVILTNVTY